MHRNLPGHQARRILTGLFAASLGLGVGQAEETLPATAEADPQGNPFRAIVARNAFRLKEPLPPPEPPPAPPPVAEVPKIDVKLAGLAEIGGVRYAYLMVPDATRPGQFEYPALTDDPKRGGGVRHRSGLEIREIDLAAQTVRLVNGGIETTLNLKEDGVKAAPAATAVAAKPGTAPTPNQPGGVNIRRPTAGVNPSQQTAANNEAAGPLIFSRNRSRATDGAADSPVVVGNTAGGVWNAAAGGAVGQPFANLPTRPLRIDTPNAPQTPPPQNQPSIPVEQQYEVLIRQRLAADTAGIPLPPIPGLPESAPPPQ